MDKQNPFATPHKKNPSGSIKLEPLDVSQEKREFSITQLLNKTMQKQQQLSNQQKSVSFIDPRSSVTDPQNDGSKTQRQPNVETDHKDAFMETMSQILNDRLTNKSHQKKSSLSPFGRNSFIQAGITTQNLQKQSISQLKSLRAQNSLDPLKSKSRNSQFINSTQQNLNSSSIDTMLQSPAQGPVIHKEGPVESQKKKNDVQDDDHANYNNSAEQQAKDDDESTNIDTFIEDTFIGNIQKFQKLKKKLLECTKEYRQYTFTHSAK